MARALGTSSQRSAAHSGQPASAGWHCPAVKVQPQPRHTCRPSAVPRLTPRRCTLPLTGADAARREQGRLRQHSHRHDRRAGLRRGTSRQRRPAWRRSTAAGRGSAVRLPPRPARPSLRSGLRQRSSMRMTSGDGCAAAAAQHACLGHTASLTQHVGHIQPRVSTGGHLQPACLPAVLPRAHCLHPETLPLEAQRSNRETYHYLLTCCRSRMRGDESVRPWTWPMCRCCARSWTRPQPRRPPRTCGMISRCYTCQSAGNGLSYVFRRQRAFMAACCAGNCRRVTQA